MTGKHLVNILAWLCVHLLYFDLKLQTWKSIAPYRPNLLTVTLPPSDPFRITNSATKGKFNNSCSIAAFKLVNPNPNPRMELVDSNRNIIKDPSLGNIAVEDVSSTLSNGKREFCGSITSPTQTEQGTKKGTARSNLYETCAANHWKPPIFECCKEEGPSHKRKFTFKVIIEIEASRNIIECYGAPHRRKKEAAEHAAEGALLYLKVYRACYEKPINK